VRRRDLGTARILSWREAIRANGSSAKQADAVMRTLSAALADAVDAGKLPTNPAAGISRLASDPVRREALSAEQAERVRAELPTLRERAFWGLLCMAGLRTEEALALRWSDVLQLSPTGGTLTIDRVFVAREFRDTTKTRKGRDVPIVAALAADLTEPLKSIELDTDAPVCPSRTGTPVNPNNWRWRVFRPAAIAAEVPSAAIAAGGTRKGVA
jgi:integrase